MSCERRRGATKREGATEPSRALEDYDYGELIKNNCKLVYACKLTKLTLSTPTHRVPTRSYARLILAALLTLLTAHALAKLCAHCTTAHSAQLTQRTQNITLCTPHSTLLVHTQKNERVCLQTLVYTSPYAYLSSFTPARCCIPYGRAIKSSPCANPARTRAFAAQVPLSVCAPAPARRQMTRTPASVACGHRS